MASSKQSKVAVRELQMPDDWDATKHVSRPSSWDKPMIRIPLPSGRYITKSLTPRPTEQETLAACIEERDRIGVAIWGVKRWRGMMAVPTRSVVKHRRDRPTPRTGDQLDERPGRAPCWIATWYEPANDSETLPRRVSRQSPPR